ncbi:microtubule-associated protein Jupiter isoform X4 [Vespula pensylvanica]|uniref:microtubule-associated protein Jupiter isoform X4 n=1 Tax=Vespula pensylvanica TaxID=30213 RepID=UPI001CBA2CD7|nr:microtubule-associated protein Jupiter isoform X4 [Vespula pensylvanica]XP_050861453.1 microtubule-associated protein Jupiter isoform X4 [Vespula vulgaris]
MATYAAYRHVELDNVGYGKKRVLKPPGGGSSDIFGSTQDETSPRRVKNHNQSQLGSALFGDAPDSSNNSNNATGNMDNNGGEITPRSGKPGNDSYNRLFGPPDAPPTTPNAKNYMRSNIPLNGDDTTSPAKSTSSSNSSSSIVNGFTNSNNSNVNDITAFRRIKRFHGNPVTGTGYTSETQNGGSAMQNGTGSSSSSIGEKSNGSSPTGKPAGTRTRVPPGGYSSGLW